MTDAASRVSDSDLMAVRSYPPELRKAILSHVGLKNLRTMNTPAATALARVLSGNDNKRRTSLICALAAYFMPAFRNYDDLSKGDCIQLLRGGQDTDVLSRTQVLALLLAGTADFPDAIVDLVLADLYWHDVALSPVALALLVHSSERLGSDAATAVREGWRELRSLHPELPQVPVSIHELRDAALMLPRDKGAALPIEDSNPAVSDTTDDHPAAAEANDQLTDIDEPSLDALCRELDQLRVTFSSACVAAERVRAALERAERPLDQDVEVILRGIQDFDGLRDRLQTQQHLPSPATTVETFQQVLDRLRSADAQRARIRSLARISGPPSIEALLQEVREAANAESQLLEPLMDLIDLAGNTQSFLEIFEAEQRFRELAPQHWLPVATAAAHGQLTIDTDEDIPSAADEQETASLLVDPTPSISEAESVISALRLDDAATPSVSESEPAQTAKNDLDDLDAFIEERLGHQLAPASAASPGVTTPETDVHEPTRTERPSSPTPAADAVQTTEPAPAQASVTPANDVSELDEALQAEACALRNKRFGLAAWIRDAAGGSSAEVNARRCAAIAGEMSEFAGRLSAAFTEYAADLSIRTLSDDTAGQLLAWAAALRTCLVHPTPEAAQLLDELAPLLSPYPGLAAYGDGFSRLAQAGAYLMPGLSGRIYDTSQAEVNRREASEAAARLLAEGPSQTIKFALATEVWKSLLQNASSGPGKLLAIAAGDDASQAENVRRDLEELRAGSALDRLIDEEAKQRATRRSSNRIHSGARTKLVVKLEKALDVVAAWVAAVHELQSSRVDDSGVARVIKHLNDLRSTVGQNRSRADDELSRLTNSTDPIIAAAASGAAALIADTLWRLDGGQNERAEPLPAHVLNNDLLLSPAIPLAVDGLTPKSKPTLEELIPRCTSAMPDWREAFESRAQRGDHEGTRALLAILAYENPALATELRLRRDKLVDTARHERGDRIEDLQDRIAEWRRDGVLPEAVANDFVTRLHALDSDVRDDFDVIADALAELEREVTSVRDREIASDERLLAKLSAENADVAAARNRIQVYIEAGDLTTAREFMAQAKVGNELPQVSDAIDHLERFFPAFPQAFEDLSAGARGRQRGRESDEWLQRLKDALHTGNDVSDADLRALLLRAGLSVPGIPRGRLGLALNGIRTWQTMAQGPKAAGNFKSAVAAVLQMIGLEGVQEPATPEQNRQWITLKQVHRLGDSLLPAFGSRMSPSGDRLRLLLVWRPPGPQQVMEWLKDQPEDQTVLVFYFGVLSAEQRQQLAALSRRRPTPVVAVLDDAAVTYLACVPDANWATTQCLLAPFTAANPYAPTGDVPEEMFYGRQGQLREVTNPTGSSFVYGGRQLGKSALLRKAERKIRETDPHRKVISEIIQDIGRVAKVSALWPRLAGRLAEAGVLSTSAASLTDPAEICREVREWIEGDPAHQLLILLDEADEFLNRDARDESFANVISLRNLMKETNNRVKVVFAGLHQTARFESLSNQPLAHLGTPIAVGPLDPRDAYNLLTEPLATLGFRFPDRLAARVIAEANNAPALIQLFADALLTRLRRTSSSHTTLPYEITRDDVDAVWRDNKLARGFRDRFEWTLNLDKRYKIIAYTVAFHALEAGPDITLTANELRSECQQWWRQGFSDSTSDGFRGLLDECVNLGVLAADGERYRLRTPHILNLLGGAEEVETILGQADTFELPDSFDAQSYRYAYKTHGERSPLTGSQITRLLSPRNVLHLVAGSPALQIDRVATALEDAADQHKQAQTLRVGVGLTLEGAVQRAAQSAEHDLLIIDLTGLPYKKAAAMARTAAKAISLPTKGHLSVVLIAPPEHATEWLATARPAGDGEVGDWTNTADLIELQPFNKAAVRQWMHEEGLGFQDEPSQDALLRITGGWPSLISKVVHALRGGRADRDQALESCQTYVEQAPEEFVRSTGVLCDKAIHSAWHTLVETDLCDTPEVLAEWLTLAAAGDESHPLSESGLQEEGYISAADLIEVLRILGALRAVDGKLRPEPVLMKATLLMGSLGD
ncbi:hypothetical protein AB0K16_17710 [Nonomuraea jabiensis]|uniref:hypothetical protein n=1 Tax=Nonomuraea jabiensis TaxID=882448 RepID=UPI00343A770D